MPFPIHVVINRNVDSTGRVDLVSRYRGEVYTYHATQQWASGQSDCDLRRWMRLYTMDCVEDEYESDEYEEDDYDYADEGPDYDSEDD